MLKESELNLEINNLNNTKDIIKKKLDSLNIDISSTVEDLNEFRDYVWIDCKGLINSDDFNSRIEFSDLLDEQIKKENKKYAQLKQKNKLIKSYKSPYFGKIIFNDNNIYIGSNQINDDLDIAVYDWRAKISSLFYDQKIGEVSYKVDDELIKGTITQKRQFVIEDSSLKSVIENEQNIEDELLQEILSKESNDKMSNIINTIQKEQNQVIRNLKDKVVITEGVAGSGKTEIALHRIAYLLYHKEEYNSSNVLILSPNNLFTNYISNVLPELSEENVLSTTYSYFAQRYINVDLETYSSFLDRVYNQNIKVDEFDENYINKLKLFLDNYVSNLKFISSISLNNTKFDKEKLNEFFNKYDKLTVMERLNKICEYILGASHIKSKYFDVVKEKLITMLSDSIDPLYIYNLFLKENNKDIIEKYCNYEHITLLLYTTFYINDYPENNNIKHVIIDEAQDYSKFQIYLLKKIFVGSSFTILGDINQNLNPFIKYDSLKDYSSLFDESTYYKLTKAYRSSKNIMDFASSILNINIDCFRHPGSKVIKRDLTNIKSDLLNDLSKFKNQRTAIITTSKSEAEYIYNMLCNDIDISSPLFDNKKGKLLVLPIYMAKGLEFNNVIVYNVKEENPNLLYVAVTRAQNNLIIY